MANVNQTPQADSGDREAHRDGCYSLARVKRKQYRGQSDPCKSAFAAAKKTHPKPNGRSSASAVGGERC